MTKSRYKPQRVPRSLRDRHEHRCSAGRSLAEIASTVKRKRPTWRSTRPHFTSARPLHRRSCATSKTPKRTLMLRKASAPTRHLAPPTKGQRTTPALRRNLLPAGRCWSRAFAPVSRLGLHGWQAMKHTGRRALDAANAVRLYARRTTTSHDGVVSTSPTVQPCGNRQ